MLNYIEFPKWLKPEIIPPLPIRWYALMYIVAFSVCYLLFKYQIKERKLEVKEDDVYSIFFWGIIGLILGARIFAITVYDTGGQFLENPVIAFLPISCRGGQCSFTGFQGMSYHGGVIGCALGIFISAKIKKLDILEWTDMIVAGIPLGYTFGRIGNFINGELFGRVTSLPWGIQFKYAEQFPVKEAWVQKAAEKAGMAIPQTGSINLPRHPSQLYEAFFEGIFLWLIIWFVFRKRKPFKGFIFSIYLIGYGIIRFLIEYVRQPDIGRFLFGWGKGSDNIHLFLSPWNFTIGQLLCFFMIIGGSICLFVLYRISKQEKTVKTIEKADIKKLRKKIK